MDEPIRHFVNTDVSYGAYVLIAMRWTLKCFVTANSPVAVTAAVTPSEMDQFNNLQRPH